MINNKIKDYCPLSINQASNLIVMFLIIILSIISPEILKGTYENHEKMGL